MKKKILGAAVTVMLGIGLTRTANVSEQEKDCSLPVFEYSLTTEAFEHASVSRHEVFWVTTADKTPGQLPAMEQWRGKKEDTKTEELEGTAVTAGKTIRRNRWDITLTDEEIDLLARILWLEARGECTQGQEAVVEVVFNRMASPAFPGTLSEVLGQKNPVQFCTWKNRGSARPTEKEYRSIASVLEGDTNILRQDTVYFSRSPLTGNLDRAIGGHCFCY